MALLDFLKRKKENEKAKVKKAPTSVSVEKKEKKAEKKSEKKAEAPIKPEVKSKRATVFSYQAISKPVISEKAGNLAQNNQYVFEVEPRYNKEEIKKSVEGIYGVNVLSVNIIKIPPKKRRLGRVEGFRKSVRKAVVRIKEGQKIEII